MSARSACGVGAAGALALLLVLLAAGVLDNGAVQSPRYAVDREAGLPTRATMPQLALPRGRNDTALEASAREADELLDERSAAGIVEPTLRGRVGLNGRGVRGVRLAARMLGYDAPDAEVVTWSDDRGRFKVAAMRGAPYRLVASVEIKGVAYEGIEFRLAAGAEVYLELIARDRTAELAIQTMYGRAIAGARIYHWAGEWQHVATSDAMGQARVGSLRRTWASLFVVHDSYPSQSASVPPTYTTGSAPIVVTMHPGLDREIQVLDGETEHPIGDATIRRVGDVPSATEVHTDDSGRAQLCIGSRSPASFLVVASGYPVRRISLSEANPEDLRVLLAKGCDLAIRTDNVPAGGTLAVATIAPDNEILAVKPFRLGDEVTFQHLPRGQRLAIRADCLDGRVATAVVILHGGARVLSLGDGELGLTEPTVKRLHITVPEGFPALTWIVKPSSIDARLFSFSGTVEESSTIELPLQDRMGWEASLRHGQTELAKTPLPRGERVGKLSADGAVVLSGTVRMGGRGVVGALIMLRGTRGELSPGSAHSGEGGKWTMLLPAGSAVGGMQVFAVHLKQGPTVHVHDSLATQLDLEVPE